MPDRLSQGFSGGSPPPPHNPESIKPGRRACVLLENALAGWEAEAMTAAIYTTFAVEAQKIPTTIRRGAIANIEKIRHFILEEGTSQSLPAHLDDFRIVKEQIDIEREEIAQDLRAKGIVSTAENTRGPLSSIDNTFAPQLLAWTRDSRRVFSLDRESAHLFTRLQYDVWKWGDILMPFKSFMVEFRNTPIGVKTSEGSAELSAESMLVTHLASVDPSYPSDAFECRIFFSNPLERDRIGISPVLTPRMRRIAERILAGERQTPDVKEYLDALVAREEEQKTNPIHTIRASGIVFRVSLSEAVVDPSLQPFTNTMRQVLAGLCLYLAHTPGTEFGTSDIRGATWQAPAARGKRSAKKVTPQRVISDEAQILDVQNIHEFDPASGRVRYTDIAGREITRHAVRTHLRRELGAPPGAPRTKRIESYWRGKELSRDALPVGAVTVIK